jgi:hypothetical protein
MDKELTVLAIFIALYLIALIAGLLNGEDDNSNENN